MKQFKQFINGKFINSTSSKVIEIVNPCTEKIISTIPAGSVEDANLALQAVKEGSTSLASFTSYSKSFFSS